MNEIYTIINLVVAFVLVGMVIFTCLTLADIIKEFNKNE